MVDGKNVERIFVPTRNLHGKSAFEGHLEICYKYDLRSNAVKALSTYVHLKNK